jgi:mRNA interferase MazF
LRRGDLVTVAVSGDFGKPRPALIIQADAFADHATVIVLLLSSAVVDAPLLRFTVAPDAINGLRVPSQIMIDKTVTDPPSLRSIEQRCADRGRKKACSVSGDSEIARP